MKYHSPWLELPAIIALSRRDREAMEAYQERQLLRLVKDVYHGNAFYRRIWDEAGFNPRQFRGREDLDRIPLVTKQQARGQISMLREKSPGGRRLVWHNTSGSSGEPFEVARSWHEERFLTVIRLWAMRSLGFRARFRLARVRVPADFDWLVDRPLRLLNRLGFYQTRVFSCYDEPEVGWTQLRAYRPDVILGYSEAIARIARYGSASQLSDIRPRFVLLGGELSTPLMRRQISEAFQAPVYQVYASTEFNLIGWSCPQSGLLHIFDPTVLVEVLDQQGKPVAAGESGQIVVTALHSRLMPFVRFVLADRVVKGPTPCPCGAPYGTLQSIDGREMDRVRLSNGEYLHGYILLNQILEGDNSWVRQYQLVQEEAGVIEMHIWPLRAPDPAVIAFLKTRMEEKTAGTEVRIKLVEGMELDANGKFHLCRCSV